MNVRGLRSGLIVALILITLLTGFPPALADSSPAQRQQSSDAARARRGKNGSSVKQATADRSAGRSQEQTNSGEGNPRADFDSSSSDSGGEPVEGWPSPATGEPQKQDKAGKSGAQPTPPPFDRAPLDPSAKGQTGGATQPASQPTSQPTSQPSRDPDVVQDQPGRQKPVLRRSESSGAPQDQSPRQKPVLRRSTDPEDNQADRQPRAAPRPGQASDDVAAPQGSDDEPIKIDATLINIPVLVSDRSGRYVPRLSEKDFTIYEDGVEQEVAFFANEEVAFNVALVLDMSPSTADNHREIQDAALAFVRQLRPQDKVMVVSFDRRVEYLTDFTSNRRELESAIRSTTVGSGTSVYDAVYETIARRMQSLDGRKALILFSDGEDTTSNRASYHEAIDAVTESDVLVYGLRYPSGGVNINTSPWPRSRRPFPDIQLPFPWPWPRRRRGNFTDLQINSGAAYATAPQRNRRGNGDFMEDVANAGGGPVYDAERIGDLSGLATRIADELRHVYVVSYYPTNPLSNGGNRSIRIRIKGRDDIAVRHRRGYNAREAHRASGT